MSLDIQKFHLSEMFNNSNGKTSPGIVVGTYLSFIGGIAFLFGAYTHSGDVMMYSTGFATLGTGLLGIRRFTQDKPIETK